jgi:hypothetical protein
MEKQSKTYKINIDAELMEVLKRLEEKVKAVTWDGLDKVSMPVLTKILARKINSSKIV